MKTETKKLLINIIELLLLLGVVALFAHFQDVRHFQNTNEDPSKSIKNYYVMVICLNTDMFAMTVLILLMEVTKAIMKVVPIQSTIRVCICIVFVLLLLYSNIDAYIIAGKQTIGEVIWIPYWKLGIPKMGIFF